MTTFDQRFIDMMVPHHLAAVEMAKIAADRGEHPEIKALATEIISAQETEIAQMRAWRKDWFGSDQTPPMDSVPMLPGREMEGDSMGGMEMGGTMDMTTDVEILRSAQPFDKAFLEAMIPHHESAITAAKLAQQSATQAEIKDLAAAIIGAQEAEIAQMRGWLAAWY
jgi:uncharacterized protein (DUF305 family)